MGGLEGLPLTKRHLGRSFKALREPGESYSDVILRFARGDPKDFTETGWDPWRGTIVPCHAKFIPISFSLAPLPPPLPDVLVDRT